MFQSREFWLSIRQAILMVVDAIEREIGISPTTSEIREMRKKKIDQSDKKEI